MKKAAALLLYLSRQTTAQKPQRLKRRLMEPVNAPYFANSAFYRAEPTAYDWNAKVKDLMSRFVVNDEKYVSELKKKYRHELSGGYFHDVFGDDLDTGVLKVFKIKNKPTFEKTYGGTEGANALVHMYLQGKGIIPDEIERPAIINDKEGVKIYVTSKTVVWKGRSMERKMLSTGYHPSAFSFKEPTYAEELTKLLEKIKDVQIETGIRMGDSLINEEGNALLVNSENFGFDESKKLFIIDADGSGPYLDQFVPNIDEQIKQLASQQWTAENANVDLEVAADGYAYPKKGGKSRKKRSKQTKRRFK